MHPASLQIGPLRMGCRGRVPCSHASKGRSLEGCHEERVSVRMLESAQNETANASLGEFLRERRLRIDPETRALGFAERPWKRIGRRVAQEEIAEAAGLSRQWYSGLERGTVDRTSTALLDRIATALMLDEQDRGTLFRLAVPELRTTALRPDDALVVEAFSWLRDYTRRLWSASSEHEALAIATEEVGARFERPPLIYSGARRPDGTWEWPLIAGDARARNRFAAFLDALRGILTPGEIDELRIYPLLAQPGEVCTEDAFRSLSIYDLLLRALEEHRLREWSMLYGRIRSRRGFIAGITVRFPNHEYSAQERATLSTLTGLTSLALS
jgi:transcriptional regulator with XRE-family HTH domain